MSEINYTAYLFLTAKFDTIIQSCIQPLKFLGISGFSYMMIHKDGRYFGINNSLEYCSYYAQNATNNRSYIGDQSIIIPENKLITSSWPHKPLNEIHKAYHSRNLWHGIDICRQTENFLEAWTFMGTLNDKDLMGHYLKNPSLLQEFISFFLPALRNVIGLVEEVPFGQYSLPPLFHPIVKTNMQPKIEEFINFLRTHRHLYSSKGFVKTSDREFQCLHLLAIGSSFKDIARKLSISPRTVEGYINSLKFKMGCSRKEKLITLYLDHLDWYGLDINKVIF